MSNVSSRRCARLEITAPPEDVIAAKRYPRAPLSCRYVRATIRDGIPARTILAVKHSAREGKSSDGRVRRGRTRCLRVSMNKLIEFYRTWYAVAN